MSGYDMGWLLDAALLDAQATRDGIPHNHAEYMDGCFRCDLSRAEMDITDTDVSITSDTSARAS